MHEYLYTEHVYQRPISLKYSSLFFLGITWHEQTLYLVITGYMVFYNASIRCEMKLKDNTS